MTAVQARHGTRASFWQRRRKAVDLLTGLPAGRLYRLGLRNETGDRVLGFRVRLLPGEIEQLEKVIVPRCLHERSQKDQINYFLDIWHVSALVEIDAEHEQTQSMFPTGVEPV